MKKSTKAKHLLSMAAMLALLCLAAGSTDGGNSSSNTNSSDSDSSGGSYTPSEAVINSGWDGSVRQVKDWLKNNLKDPKSTEYIEWSPVQKTTDGGYMVRCKYRSKNSFGGYVIANQIFYLDSNGNVTSYTDFK